MKFSRSIALLSAAAAAAVATSLMTGCEADESAPSPPHQTFFQTDEKGAENAKKREEEKRAKELPTNGPEFPGQSQMSPYQPSMITAVDMGTDATIPASSSAPAATGTDISATRTDTPLVGESAPAAPLPTAAARQTAPSFGMLPHLNTLPSDHYAEGSVSVPGIAYPADFSTGQVLPLPSAPHRNWPITVLAVKSGVTDGNPTYYKELAQVHPNLSLFTSTDTGYGTLTSPGAANAAPVVENNVGNAAGINNKSVTRFFTGAGNNLNNALEYPKINSGGTDALNMVGLNAGNTAAFPTVGTSITGFASDIGESAWFLLQTVVLPVEMILQHPLAHVQSRVPVTDPLYQGFLSEGPIVPTAYPGAIRWTYPWTRDLNSTLPVNANPSTEDTPDMTPKEHP